MKLDSLIVEVHATTNRGLISSRIERIITINDIKFVWHDGQRYVKLIGTDNEVYEYNTTDFSLVLAGSTVESIVLY